MKSKFFLICFILVLASQLKGQNIIEPIEGFSPQIGTTLAMMEDLKKRVNYSVSGLSEEATDFLLDEDANRIGAMILHLAATEKYYQLYTFEGRGFNSEEMKKWNTALSLGENAREELQGKPIDYYLKIWDEVRQETFRLLKTKDDKWFASKVKGSSMNNHWAWYHVMEHQANHMGQIRLIIKRFEN
ncbi:MAG: DinB family protein [Cyclobacteriaceae bacterium]